MHLTQYTTYTTLDDVLMKDSIYALVPKAGFRSRLPEDPLGVSWIQCSVELAGYPAVHGRFCI